MAATLVLAPPAAFAQEEEQPEEDEAARAELDNVVVTGTRKAGITPTESLSPVDLLEGDLFTNQANFDFTDSFTRIAPTLNTQRFPIADGTAFVRPVTLRNLSPDHTLVLINGTRRHRSALVNLQLAPLGTVNQGSQGVDFATIPAAAIDRVEVLRDGASAQYGSDAIAGVVNIILKDDDEGGMAYVMQGEYKEGDGSRTIASVNNGFELGQGFLNVTFEYATSDETSRGAARPDAEFVGSVVGADLVPEEGLGQRWGDPNVDGMKFFANIGHPVGETAEFYSHLSYSTIDTLSDFFYRTPVLDPVSQLTVSARRTLQIDDDGDGLPDPAPQSLVDSITNAGLDPADYLVADAGSPSGYVLRNPIYTQFPGGYNPDFGADITDYAVVLGAKGEMANGWSWDLSGRFEMNEVDYKISQTINPSLGRLSPTSFRPGTLRQEESGINLDFVKPVDVAAFHAPLNVAFGAELRNETYEIEAGDLASREAGPTAAVFGVGSDGFQGFPTESAGSFESDSHAAYVDLETDFTDALSGGVALRFEDYDTFGSTSDWKVAGRYELTDVVALRATANTGFRAPTPGQINTLNVTTSADASGNLIPSGTYPVNHPIAVALGAQPLEPEESQSFTIGLAVQPEDGIWATLDYYQIDIEKRMALRNITIGPAEVAQLQAAGVPNANLLLGSLANFFVNAFDSEVTGVDLATGGNMNLGPGLLIVDLRHNYNKQEVTNVPPNTINASRVFDLENQVPNHRTALTFSYKTRRLNGLLRFNRYDGWESTGGLFSPGDASDASSYGSALLVDVEVSYALTDNIEFTVGGENVTDEYPDPEQDPVLQFLGVRHSLTSPFGFNGAFWYARLTGRW
ncbi:MAG TPA: TonB-dependent receptor [Gammaproteobacteria bacterium]|nr:TonB-dependent receptor [Gammaproteobacteria bacterium]